MGLDGGGTKTDCVLMDEAGRILAKGPGGPSNSSRIGTNAAAHGVREAATAALQNAGLAIEQLTDVCAGLAGVALPGRARAMTAILQPFFSPARFELCTDLDLALAAAGAAPAIVLVAGTGSAAIGKDASGRVARSGGHGPKSSDEGSAFAIGKKAIRELTKDFRSEHENLSGKILQLLAMPSLERLAELEGTEADAVYPRVFPLIANAADQGEELATRLLREASENLAGFVADVQAELRLGGAVFVLGKTGGMISRSKYFDEQLDAALRRIAPAATLQNLTTPLAEVAAKRALGL